MQRAVVSMKPLSSFSPGVTSLAMTPAINPMRMIQRMCMFLAPKSSPLHRYRAYRGAGGCAMGDPALLVPLRPPLWRNSSGPILLLHRAGDGIPLRATDQTLDPIGCLLRPPDLSAANSVVPRPL